MTAPALSSLDRLDRIRVRIAERKGATWEDGGWQGSFLIFRDAVAMRVAAGREAVWRHNDWVADRSLALDLLDELSADGWSWQMWNGSAPGRVSCRAERDVDSHLVTDRPFAEALSLLWLKCMGEDVSDLMENSDG